ncbi:Golgi resident protein GCP60 [Schistosoma japonicum]|nr:Golgi resident protein GCP60 [Schistosoma japonicum]
MSEHNMNNINCTAQSESSVHSSEAQTENLLSSDVTVSSVSCTNTSDHDKLGFNNDPCPNASLVVHAPTLWTRGEVKEFKLCLAEDEESVRVQTHPSGTSIVWEFATDDYDIGFGLFFEWTEAISDPEVKHNNHVLPINKGDAPSEVINAGNSEQSSILVDEIIPISRQNSQSEVCCGSHLYPGPGTYVFKFDNSFSLWRSKTLYYRIDCLGERLQIYTLDKLFRPTFQTDDASMYNSVQDFYELLLTVINVVEGTVLFLFQSRPKGDILLTTLLPKKLVIRIMNSCTFKNQNINMMKKTTHNSSCIQHKLWTNIGNLTRFIKFKSLVEGRQNIKVHTLKQHYHSYEYMKEMIETVVGRIIILMRTEIYQDFIELQINSVKNVRSSILICLDLTATSILDEFDQSVLGVNNTDTQTLNIKPVETFASIHNLLDNLFEWHSVSDTQQLFNVELINFLGGVTAKRLTSFSLEHDVKSTLVSRKSLFSLFICLLLLILNDGLILIPISSLRFNIRIEYNTYIIVTNNLKEKQTDAVNETYTVLMPHRFVRSSTVSVKMMMDNNLFYSEFLIYYLVYAL